MCAREFIIYFPSLPRLEIFLCGHPGGDGPDQSPHPRTTAVIYSSYPGQPAAGRLAERKTPGTEPGVCSRARPVVGEAARWTIPACAVLQGDHLLRALGQRTKRATTWHRIARDSSIKAALVHPVKVATTAARNSKTMQAISRRNQAKTSVGGMNGP